jgi:hypothetical protein
LPWKDKGSRDGGIGGDPGRAVDPQGLFHARNEEQQADLGTGQQVGQRVDPPVSRPVGDHQGAVVEHLDEAGMIAARRDVGRALAVRRADHQERGPGDEVAAMAVQPGKRLLLGQLLGLAVMRPQRGGVGDGLFTHNTIP